jgi:hypothetical protein
VSLRRKRKAAMEEKDERGAGEHLPTSAIDLYALVQENLGENIPAVAIYIHARRPEKYGYGYGYGYGRLLHRTFMHVRARLCVFAYVGSRVYRPVLYGRLRESALILYTGSPLSYCTREANSRIVHGHAEAALSYHTDPIRWECIRDPTGSDPQTRHIPLNGIGAEADHTDSSIFAGLLKLPSPSPSRSMYTVQRKSLQLS